jgi:hypothetical protein
MFEDICQCESPSQKIIILFPLRTNPNCSHCGKPITVESIKNAVRIGRKKWLEKQ